MDSARRIGPYEIVREIARGGMGVVYEVRHPNTQRRLALKLILNAQGPRALEHERRFEREAEILAKVDRHPHVLKVHQLGKLEDRHFLVTEYVEGAPLSKALPLDPKRAATIVRKVADALAYVHGRGVLHRDVKPDNILLRADEPDSPVLVDFGLAWVGEAERLTRTGTTMGTPAYMAPEQASGGQGANLDARADVYALGATLFAALTGDEPFQADSMSELMAKILTAPATAPSERRQEVPRALDAIVLHALEKEREKRYPDAAALRDDLDRWLRGEPPLALGLVRLPGRRRIRNALLATVGVVAVAGALGGAVTLARARGVRRTYARALDAAEQAARAAARARHSSDAPERLEALEKAAAVLAATAAPPGVAPWPRARVDLVASLLRAERDARTTGDADERARALERAAKAAQDYLADARTLGVTATNATEDLADLGEREAELAAALADSTAGEAVARELLARPESREPSRAERLERARALWRLGEPALARKPAELAVGNDGPGLEARLLGARAALATLDLPHARALASGVVESSAEPAVRARAAAVLARVELARGDPSAAQAVLDATPERVEAEIVLARAEVALARRAPAEVVAGTLAALERRTRDPGVEARAASLLGEAQILQELEGFAPRQALPAFGEARTTLARAGALAAKPGATEARGDVARALVVLAACEEQAGLAAEAAERRLEAAAIAPFSVEAALSLLDDLGQGRRVAPAEAARALARTAAAIDDAPARAALEALAAGVRGGSARPAVAALASAAQGASGARARAAFALLVGRVAARGERPAGVDVAGAPDVLRSAGALEALVLDRARERVAFAFDAEAYLEHGVAASRAGERRRDETQFSRGVPGELADGLSATRATLARGDAPVAVVACELALALSPALADARREKARAVAQILRGARPDLAPEANGLGDRAVLGRVLLERPGGAKALAAAALAGLAGLDPVADPLDTAELSLARGRESFAAGVVPEAVAELRAARDAGEALVVSLRKDPRATPHRIAMAMTVHASALADMAFVAAQSGDELGAASARGDVADDADDRGNSAMDVVVEARTLDVLGEQAGDFGEGGNDITARCAAERVVVGEKLEKAPLCSDAFGRFAMAELSDGNVVTSYLDWHRYFVLRGPLRNELLVLRREFGPQFRKEAGMTRLSVEELGAAADAAAPDDAGAPLARASRELYAVPTGPDVAARRPALERIHANLDRAERLAPGAAALLGFRALADLAAGEPELARSRFARMRELQGADTGTKYVELFEACSYARFGFHDDAKRSLVAVRDGKEIDRSDSVSIRGEGFDEVRAFDDLAAIVAEIDRRFLGPRDGNR